MLHWPQVRTLNAHHRRLFPTLWYVALCAALLTASTAGAQRTRETYVLSGTVANQVTGEPIARALVRAAGQVSRTTFTDEQGHFEFDGLPAGQISLFAQKPGYTAFPLHSVTVGPNTGPARIQLAPQPAIFGRITDSSGQPIEHVTVRLTCRSLREGRTVWEPRGSVETDDDGHFRFANLMPGTYYLAAGPGQNESRLLAANEKPASGYPLVYYSGVPDLASATPIQLTPGQQMQADVTLNAVPVYQVTGNVVGQPPDRPVAVIVATGSGEPLPMGAHFNPELGTFTLDALPAGSYVLQAMTNMDQQRLIAEQKIVVTGNLENVQLALAPALSIPVVVHQQARGASGAAESSGPRIGAVRGSQNLPPVSVRLMSSQPNGREFYSSYERRGNSDTALLLQSVDPGTYTVKLMPQPPWYVQSATYGQTNVLSDDITVVPGQRYPLDIVLRDDSASLTISFRGSENDSQQRATLVILPQPSSRATPTVLYGGRTTYTATGLAPGEYLVFAFEGFDPSGGSGHDAIEYGNPDALAPYASQAAHVTLNANQTAPVSVDVIKFGKEE